jgi:FkbM family methyltransferase
MLDKMNKNFYREFFNEGDLVYDVGANVGEWADALLENGAGEVLCVEPQQELTKYLLEHFMDKPVRILHCALGDFRGKTNMYQCEVNTVASLSTEWKEHRFAGYSWKTGEEVMVITLDEVIGYYGVPKFVKIDVEGYELNVLKGLSIPIHSFCIEYTMEIIDQIYKCMDVLESLGEYEYSYNTGDYPVFKHIWSSPKTIIFEIKKQYNDDLWGSLYARRKYD